MVRDPIAVTVAVSGALIAAYLVADIVARVVHSTLHTIIEDAQGEAIVWHFGLTPNGYSSLYLKIPSRRLTLILLANSDGLSSAFDLPSGDVTKSLFAVLFLRLFA